MNQKYFNYILLVVIIVALVGAVGYFALIKKSAPILTQAQEKASNEIQTNTAPPNMQATASKQNANLTPEKEFPSIIIGGVKKQILYPSFTWNLATSTPFSPVVSVVPTSQAKGKESGPSIVQGQAWESLVNASLPDSVSQFEKYYSDLYSSFEATNESGLGINSGEAPGYFNLAGYDFGPISASGPLGEVWGYLFKRGGYEFVNMSEFTKDTVQELALSYDSANTDGSLCKKDNCPFIKFVVFWSDLKSVGDILRTASWN